LDKIITVYFALAGCPWFPGQCNLSKCEFPPGPTSFTTRFVFTEFLQSDKRHLTQFSRLPYTLRNETSLGFSAAQPKRHRSAVVCHYLRRFQEQAHNSQAFIVYKTHTHIPTLRYSLFFSTPPRMVRVSLTSTRAP